MDEDAVSTFALIPRMIQQVNSDIQFDFIVGFSILFRQPEQLFELVRKLLLYAIMGLKDLLYGLRSGAPQGPARFHAL